MRTLLSVLVAAILATAPAIEVGKATFADRIAVAGSELAVRGATTFTWAWFEVYQICLWLPADVAATRVLDADVPRRLEFVYRRNLSAKDFRKATDKTVGVDAEPAVRARLAPAIAAINSLYQDCGPGDRQALTFIPGGGVTLTRNGVDLGTVGDAEFAHHLFAVWLGSKPLDDGMRDKLLGR